MIDNNTTYNLPENIEDIHETEVDILRIYYLTFYENQYKDDFIRLIKDKLNNPQIPLAHYNPLNGHKNTGLNRKQLSKINQIINSNDSIDIKFKNCLNELSFHQINYIGW